MDDRQLQRAVRGLADDDSARLGSLPLTRQFIGTVTSTSPLEVTWRGANVPMAGKNANYAPVVGDRVRCSLTDGQPLIDFAIDGQP